MGYQLKNDKNGITNAIQELPIIQIESWLVILHLLMFTFIQSLVVSPTNLEKV
jgi:hypothetical protein